MSIEAIVAVALAVALASLSLIGTSAAWRMLGRAGRDMRRAEDRLSERAMGLPADAAAVRARLAAARGEVEVVLWRVAKSDDRMEAMQLAMAEKRAGSDRLRASMARNGRLLEQLRTGARMLLRAIQMRREFLG